jgi:chromodomain-helicase-DNA-binding protein 7
VCNHPFLIKGVEEKEVSDPSQLFDSLVQASGKMILLDKLLPSLKKNGHKVKREMEEEERKKTK